MVAEVGEHLGVFVVQEDTEIRSFITAILDAQGYRNESFESALQALPQLENYDVPIILIEPSKQDEAGIDFISQAKGRNPQVQVIVIGALGRVDLAVKAIRHGAFDFLPKPLTQDSLVLSLTRLEEHLRVVAENQQLKEEVDRTFSFAGIVSHNEVMKEVFETVKRLASFNSTVLISGESGTGKELVARAIHNNSLRRGHPFIAINCGAIPENLIESELFGHKKGAFTDAVRDKRGLLEEANGGTLFLDEIGEMPGLLQVKLLRALQERAIRPIGEEKSIAIDTRVLAATNRNLEEDIKSGHFREDLYYRLNVVSLHLPPLRERKEDIPILCDYFLMKMSRRLSLPEKKVSASMLAKLADYAWPGNIRELENYLERALVFSKGPVLEVADLPEQVRSFNAENSPLSAFSNDSLSIKLHAESLETRLIKEALIRTGGNRTHAARLLEISHRALLYKLKDYQLTDFLKGL